MTTENAVRCPRCKSTQVHAEKRGYRFMRGGVFGSSKIMITCLNCGRQFKPGMGHKEKEEPHPAVLAMVAVLWLIVLCLVLFG